MTGRYDEIHARSLADPNGFWGEAAEAIHWFKKPEFILDDRNPQRPRWFTGGETNAAFNALDRHVDAGRGNQAARSGPLQQTTARCDEFRHATSP